MTPAPIPASGSCVDRNTSLGIAAVSLAILLLQIGLTRLLSVVLWYHFAFVAISLAMLGLALAGVLLYLRPRLLAATPKALPWYCRGAGATMVAALVYVLKFPPPTGAGDASGMLTSSIVSLYLLLLVPFTLAGLSVSAVLAYHREHIGRLYASDLAGAGLGCLLAVPLLNVGGAPTAILAGTIVLLLGGLLFAPSVGARRVDVALLVGAAILLGAQASTGWLEPVAMHGIPDADPATHRVVDFTGWNSHSRIVVSSTEGDPNSIKTINIDGSATTSIYHIDGLATPEHVRSQLEAMPLRFGSMPYAALTEHPSVLLIGPGGGLDLLNGIYYGAHMTAVELNGLIHGLMTSGPIADWSGNVYTAPDVQVVHDEARSWVSRTDRQFDLIQASMIDTWAATAGGAFALAENSLYTVEAFLDYRAHLTDQGLVHFMRWHEQPPRQSLRVLALIVEAMHRCGDTAPEQHVIVLEEPLVSVTTAPMASVIWSKQPFTAPRLARIRAELERRQTVLPIRILCWPGEEHDNEMSRFLRATDRAAFLRQYPFDVSPTTDDRPFFFHTVRFTDVLRGGTMEQANEQAVEVLGTVLVIVLVIATLAFVLPMAATLRRARRDGTRAIAGKLGYFCALGLGFMLVEIPVLQRFGLYLGHPTWSLSTVLGSLLLGAGAGGSLTATIDAAGRVRALHRALLLILCLLAGLSLLAPMLLAATLVWSFAARVLLTIAVLVPTGFALGRALPLGVGTLNDTAAPLVPWAWGMNGATSVLASVLAVAIGMQAGFTIALLGGVGCYLLALLLARSLRS